MGELREDLAAVLALLDKATKAPWAFMKEGRDYCLLAFGTDKLDFDAPPPWYSTWTSIKPNDSRALIAAVNFLREHGAALSRSEVPAGWVLVPVEPTSQMLEFGTGGAYSLKARIWSEMLAAAPTPPAQAEVRSED